jgi:AraC-like DNA-binding protein
VAEDWERLQDVVERSAADVAVVDPIADGTMRTQAVAALLDSHPAVPLVLYTAVSPATFKAVAELTRHGAHQIVLYRYDDEPTRLLRLIERQPGHALTSALLQRMTPGVAALPPELAHAVQRLFRRPGAFRCAADLSSVSGVSRRTMYREFARSGLASPRTVVAAARVLRAYSYTRDRSQSLDQIAQKLRYSAPRVLSQHMRDLLGATPRSARHRERDEELVQRLADRLYEPPAA